jgi:hypothetical protein
MENATATSDPSVDVKDVAVTGYAAATVQTASTTTTATATNNKPKAKVKKEMTAAEREVQNQKR